MAESAEFAAIHTTIAEQQAGAQAALMVHPDTPIGKTALYGFTALPARVTLHLTTDAGFGWVRMLDLFDDESRTFIRGGIGPEYTPGRGHRLHLGTAVFLPTLPSPSWVSRTGDQLALGLPLGDGGNSFAHEQWPGRLTVRKGGTEVGSLDYPYQGPPAAVVQAPAGPGKFQVDLDVAATSWSDLSRKTRSSWQFTSDTTSAATPLPLWAFRISPPVNERNTVGRRPHLVPVTALAPAGAAVGRLEKIEVSVSTDEGQRWRKVPARSTGAGKFVALVPALSTGEDVSLKVRGTDTAGNAVEQLVVRAYHLKL